MKTEFTNPLFPYAEKGTFPEELEVLREIDEVVDIIKNGRWHTLEDVIKEARLPKPKTNKILEFLADYDFICLDSKRQKVKVTPSLVEFLKEDQAY